MIGRICLTFLGTVGTLPLALGQPPLSTRAGELLAPLRVVNGVQQHTYSTKSGLRVRVTRGWFEEGGYQPLRVFVESQTPATTARSLEAILVFQPAARRTGHEAVVRQKMTLKKGESATNVTVLCPSETYAGTFTVTIEVDGELDPELSSGQGWHNLGQPQSPLRILAPVFDGAPLATGPQLENAWGALLDRAAAAMTGTSRPGPAVVRCQPMDDWLAYSAADVIQIELAQLRVAAREDRPHLDAIRRWIFAGGALWVAHSGSDTKVLREIDRLLGITPWRFRTTAKERGDDPPAGTEDPEEPVEDQVVGDLLSPDESEEDPKAGRSIEFVAEVEGAPGWGYDALRWNGPAPREIRSLVVQENSRRLSDTRKLYAVREAGFGRVHAFTDETLGGVRSPGHRRSLLFGHAALNRSWPRRHGLRPGGTSPAFGNLMIPGIGAAPVGLFQVLITLFVLAIGPLNYWLLYRRGQLQLLVFTVPIGALAVTLALVTYAAVSDGFGVKARVRGVALIDQSTGEFATWNRVSHYVATAPSEPATLPGDTAIYPISAAWETAVASRSTKTELEWVDGQQQLVQGWTPSRSAVQHMIVRSGKTKARLAFVEQHDSFEVDNRLGTRIDLLLVRGPDGEWSMAESIEPEGEARLTPIERIEAVKSIRLTALDHEPEFPVGAGRAAEDTVQRLSGLSQGRRSRQSFSDVSLDENLGERMIDRLTGMDGSRGLDLPPRSYVAVTSESVVAPLGWETVEEIGSFYLIAGRW